MSSRDGLLANERGVWGGPDRGASPDGFQARDRDRGRDFKSTAKQIAKAVKSVGKAVRSAEKGVRDIGTGSDSAFLREELQSSRQKTTRRIQDANRAIEEDLAPLVLQEPSPAEQRRREKAIRELRQQLKAAQQKWQGACQDLGRALRSNPEPPLSGTGATAAAAGGGGALFGGGGGDLEAGDMQDHDLQQLDLAEDLAAERAREASALVHTSTQLRDTVGELNDQIRQQGEGVQAVKANVEEAHKDATKGVGHLENANSYQKGTRNRIICLLLILLVIGGAITAWVLIKNAGK